ncbi:MAG: lipoate--protein ligase [Spirochaetales bacterium]|nr:lipoate--protein ligase [Spirochaetales bacterium]
MSSLRVFITGVDDPWFNLATEDWIFRDMDPDHQVLFLWRNSDTVVIGRFQNPWAECRVDKMETDGVRLARRQSGGGAVFQDLGNTCFTFLSGRNNYSIERNFEIIIRALRRFGIDAAMSGRNDILVDGRKVSGSAFKLTADRAFHHGTLLISTDLGRLAHYLNPDAGKLVAKGISSVRSRVANLSEFYSGLTGEVLSQAVIEEFFNTYQDRCPVEELNYETLKDIPHLADYYRHMADWDWRFGKTPEFSHHLETRFSWGGVNLHLDVRRGIIRQARVYSDCLYPDVIEGLQGVLPGVRYLKDDLVAAVAAIPTADEAEKSLVAEIADWLSDNL